MDRRECGSASPNQLSKIDRRIERRLSAIGAGVDPVLVGKRIRDLKAERAEARVVLAQLEHSAPQRTALDPEDAAAILAALPDLGKALATPIPSSAAPSSMLSADGSRDRPQRQ